MPFDFIPPNTTLTLLKDHPLDGAFERLDRADENIRRLDERLVEFRNRFPQAFSTHLDVATGQFSYRARSVRNPGLWVPVLVGEILFLLRSSLDHFVAQWLLPRTPAVERDLVLERSAFPIYIDGDWQSFDWTKIPKATTELKAALTECQPCNRTDGLSVVDHPLAVLSSMHNIDKHRLLLVTVVKADATATVGPEFVGTVNPFEGGDYIAGSSAVTGHVEAQLYTGQLDAGGVLDVEFEGSTSIAFKQVGTRRGEPVVSTLESLSGYVRSLMTDFKTKLF